MTPNLSAHTTTCHALTPISLQICQGNKQHTPPLFMLPSQGRAGTALFLVLGGVTRCFVNRCHIDGVWTLRCLSHASDHIQGFAACIDAVNDYIEANHWSVGDFKVNSQPSLIKDSTSLRVETFTPALVPYPTPDNILCSDWNLGRSLSPKIHGDLSIEPPRPEGPGDWILRRKESRPVTVFGPTKRYRQVIVWEWANQSPGSDEVVSVDPSAGLFESSRGVFWDARILHLARSIVSSSGGVSIQTMWKMLLEAYQAQARLDERSEHDCPNVQQFTLAFHSYLSAQVMCPPIFST